MYYQTEPTFIIIDCKDSLRVMEGGTSIRDSREDNVKASISC